MSRKKEADHRGICRIQHSDKRLFCVFNLLKEAPRICNPIMDWIVRFGNVCLFPPLFLLYVGHKSCARQAAGDGCDHHICRSYQNIEWDCDRKEKYKVMFTPKLMHVSPDLHLVFTFSMTIFFERETVFVIPCCRLILLLAFSDLFLWQSICENMYPLWVWMVVLKSVSVCWHLHSSKRKYPG